MTFGRSRLVLELLEDAERDLAQGHREGGGDRSRPGSALVGDSENVSRLREALLTDKATGNRARGGPAISGGARRADAAEMDDFAFVLYASGPAGTVGARGPNSVPIVGSPEDVAAGMIAQRPDLAVTLARRFPVFRVAASNRLINDTCRVKHTSP